MMTTEKAKEVLENEILPLYRHQISVGLKPTILVVSMGLLTELHRLMDNKEIFFDLTEANRKLKPNKDDEDGIELHWSGSEEDCTWALI